MSRLGEEHWVVAGKVANVTYMSDLKARLRAELTTAMKARNELATSTIRMTLTAITNEEVAGKESRELSDAEVLKVIAKEAKKRREAAEAFAAGGRAEQAAREAAEGDFLDEYLPQQLSDDELRQLVTAAVAESGATTQREMGAVMKLVNSQIAGRADGKRVSDQVRSQLTQ